MTKLWLKKFAALTLSVPIGLSLTVLVLWIFGIEVAVVERWKSFPDGWRIFDLVTNGAAVLMLFGTIRAAYRVLTELWIQQAPPPGNLPASRADLD